MNDPIQRYYDATAAAEWARLERYRTEYALTGRALREHLPPAPARVLDCGGGPGRYAIDLARQGYAVTLFDWLENPPQVPALEREGKGRFLASFSMPTE